SSSVDSLIPPGYKKPRSRQLRADWPCSPIGDNQSLSPEFRPTNRHLTFSRNHLRIRSGSQTAPTGINTRGETTGFSEVCPPVTSLKNPALLVRIGTGLSDTATCAKPTLTRT